MFTGYCQNDIVDLVVDNFGLIKYQELLERISHRRLDMRDNVAREDIAGMKKDLEYLSAALDKVDVDNYDFKDYKRRFIELARELGLEFGEDGVLIREANINSSLGRLQAQITALVEAAGFKETYADGILRYEKVR